MLYQTKKPPLRARFRRLLQVTLPFRSRQVTDIRELSPHLRADIGAGDSNDPCFR